MTPNCRNIIHMFTHYTWDDFKNMKTPRAPKEGIPNDQFKDFADVVGYGVVNNPQYIDPEEGLSPVIDWDSIRNLGLN